MESQKARAAGIASQRRTASYFLGSFVMLANVIDAATTLVAVSKGNLEENPLMAALLAISPFAFLGVKTFGIAAALLFLVKYRHLGLAYFGLMLLATVYGALLVHQAISLTFFM